MAELPISRRVVLNSNSGTIKRVGRSAHGRNSLRRTQTLLAISAAAGLAGLATTLRADTYGSNGGSPLNLNTSWIDESASGTQPGASDIAQWDSNDTTNGTFSLGAALTWGELSVTGGYTFGAITIDDAGNEASDTLTLNGLAAGINMSTATQNLTIEDDVILGGAQSWNVNTGTTLTVGGAAASALSDNNLLTTGGAGNIVISAPISGGGGLTVGGTGAVTLSGANTSYSGTTTLSSGTLNINNASALGTGSFVINGGTFNTNAGITNAGNNPITVNGSFTFTGTAALNMGTGAVTLATANPTINVAASTLTLGGAVSGTTLTKAGAGTLLLSAANSFTSAVVNGGLLSLSANQTTITNYTVNSGGALTLGGTQAAGTASTPIVTLNGGSTLTVNATLLATNFIYATGIGGSATINGTGAGNSMQALFEGNGNLTWNAGTLSTVGNNGTVPGSMFGAFGGTVAFPSTNAGSIRADNGTADGTMIDPYTTFDFGTGAGSVTNRGGSGASALVLGAVAGTGGASEFGSGTNGTGTNDVYVGSVNSSTTFAGEIVYNSGDNPPALFKVGTGTLLLTDITTGNTLDRGGTNADGGKLEISYAANPSGVLVTTAPLGFASGTLYLLGNSSGVTTQTVANATVGTAISTGTTVIATPGGGTLVVDPNGGTSTTLTMGTLTASAVGSTLNIEPSYITVGSGTAAITTTTNKLADGTYGARITYGSDWATTASGTSPYTLSAYSGYNTLASGFVGGIDTTDDQISSTTGNLQLTSAYTTNSLKINPGASQQLDLNGQTLSLTNGGLLFAGSNNFSLGLGVNAADTIKSLNSATTSDLIVQQMGTGNLTIAAVIANGGSGASTLTKSGPGTLILTGTNTYTGITYLNGGTTVVTSDSNLGLATTGAAIDINGGTLEANATMALDNAGSNKRPVGIGGAGATFDVTAGNTLTIDGTITNSAANQYGPLIKTDAGTLVIINGNANSTYLGATIISGGILSVPSLPNGEAANSPLGSAPSAAPALVLNGGTLQYTGAAASTNRTFTLTNNGGGIDGSGTGAIDFTDTTPLVTTSTLAGTGSRTFMLTGTFGTSLATSNIFSGQIIDGTGGATGLTKSNTGGWVLANANNTYTGNTNVNGGTLYLSSASTNPISTSAHINIASGATLDVTGLTSSTLALGTQTLTGSGSVNGSVNGGSSGIIAPGTLIANTSQSGTLTTSNLALASGTTLDFGLSNANLNGSLTAAADLISTSVLTLPSSGAIAQFFTPGFSSQFSGVPTGQSATYDLIHYSSLAGSALTPTGTFTVGNGNGAYSYSFGDTGASNGYLTVTITSNGVASNWIDTSGANPGSWTTLTNWSGGVPGTGSSGSGIGDSAIFGSPSATILNVSLNSAETVGSVVFAGTGSYAISGGNTLTLNNGSTSGPSIQDLGGNQAINVPINLAPSGAGLATTVTVSNSGDTLTLGAAVSGAGPLTKAGSGSLILSTADSYSGGTNINGGILQFSNINQLGSSSNITFGGGTLQYNGNTTDISAGTVTLAAGGGTIDTNGQNVTFANSIGNGGSGGFTKTGAGTLTLASTTNSYSGNTTVTGGTLNFAALAGLGTGTGITVNGGTLQWATSNLADISTRTVTIGANSGTFDANGNALVFTGAIGNNGSGNLTLTSSAANGSFTFDSASTYGGTTTINNLPVTINNNATLGAGAVTFLGINGSITSDYTANTLGLPGINVGSGAVGTITGSNRTSIAGLSGSGTVNLISTALPTLASGSPTGLLLASGTYSSFSGTINMSSSSSANNAVILDFNSGGFPGNMPSATVNLTNNVRLSSTNNSGGNTWTVGALEGDATSILAGSDYPGTTASSLTAVIGDSASTTFNGTLVNGNGGAGGLIITKQGTGVLTLTNGNSTYTGATNINGGYLRLMNGTTGSATGYSTAISVNNGGTLAGNGTISATANSALAVVTVASGGAIAPEYGSVAANGSVGTLTMDNLTLNTGSILNLEFNSAISGVTPDNGDLINVTGGTGLTINGGVVNPYNATTGALLTTPGTYNLIEYTGGTDSSGVLSPGAAALAAETPDHISYSFNNNGSFNGNSYVQLTITSNPPNYWTNGNHNSLWDTGDPGNWSTGVVPNGSIAIADFDSSAGGYTTPQNVSLSGGTVDVEQLIFHSAYAVSIGNGTINFDAGSLDSINVQALGSTVQAHTISAGIGVQNSALGLNVTVTNAADSLTFSGGFNGSGPLNVNAGGAGSGTIVLSADNTNFTGNTNVAGGALELAHTNALAGSSLSVTSPGAVTFAPSIGTFNVAAITSGNITLQDTSANPVTLAVGGQGASFTYTGALSGTGSLTKNGTGTMTIAPTGTATSITGTVNVNSGTLNVSAANAFTATNVTLAANATIDSTGSGDSFNNTNPMLMNGASTFTWGGSANFPVNNILLAPSATAANPAVLYSSGSTASEFGGTVTFDPGGQSVLVVENGSGINISLNSGTTNFSGTGTVVVPAANNTVGSTTYQYAGAIRFTNGGGLATNGGPGITFDVDGSIYTRTGTTGAGIVMGALTNDPGTPGSLGGQSATPIANTLYTIGALGESTTFGGTIVDGGDGTASIAVNGGTLTLTGASTYSGGTTVEAAGAELNLDYAGSLNPATTPTATTALSASAGTLLLNGTIAPTSILQATGGTIIVGDANNNPNSSPSGTPSARTIASLSVSSGKIQLANSTNGQINRSVLVVGTEGSVAGVTTFTGTGTLDLGSNDMIVTTSATDVNNTGELAALTAAAKSGLAGGWTGTGLVTSSGTFANNHNLNTGVAIVVNDTNQSGTALNGSPLIGTAQFNNGESQFDGQSVTDGDILVKYTYFGDALLDGNVTSADYLQIDNGFNNHLTGWYNGDFNYDGVVNGDDYSLIDNAYNSQGTAFPTSVSAGPAEMIASDTAQIDSVATPAVPEPTTLGMLGIGAAGMLMRRRRRNA